MGRASSWKRRRAEATTARPPSKEPWEFVRPDATHFYKYGSNLEWLDRELALMEFRLARYSKAHLLEMLQQAFHEETNKNRIYSMSLSDDTEDLWERYGGGHAGYCLEFANEGLFRQASLVSYGDEFLFDVTAPNAATAHHFYRKTMIWSVQQEVRIVTFPRGADALQPFDPKLLRRIILGRLMPEQARVRIGALASRRSPPLEVVEH